MTAPTATRQRLVTDRVLDTTSRVQRALHEIAADVVDPAGFIWPELVVPWSRTAGPVRDASRALAQFRLDVLEFRETLEEEES